MDITVCGSETVSLTKNQDVILSFDSWTENLKISNEDLKSYATSSDPDCPIVSIELRQFSDKSKAFVSDSVYLTEAVYSSTELQIVPTKNKEKLIQFYIAYKTQNAEGGY